MANDAASRHDEAVEELFGQTGGQPRPQLMRVGLSLFTGLFLAIFGLACTSVPGGLLVLLSAYLLDTDLQRVESGYLPVDHLPRLKRWRAGIAVAIAIVIALFVLQFVLLYLGFYTQLWGGIIFAISTLLLPPGAAPLSP